MPRATLAACFHNLIAGTGLAKARTLTPVTSYKFEVGSLVRLTTPIPRAADGQYQVMGRLPVEGATLRYRIKSADEPYERVVNEYQLKALKRSS